MNRSHLAALFLLSIWTGSQFLSSQGQDVPPQGLTKAAANSHPAPAFEVVSIRPSSPGNQNWYVSTPQNGDEYRSVALPLGNTILDAYFPSALQRRERVPGAPAWIWSDNFDFVGKVAPGDLDAWHESLRHGLGQPNPLLEKMLQAALRDRCKLVVHRVPATYPGFALVVSPHGPNAKRFAASKPGETVPDSALKMPEDGRMVPIMDNDDPVTRFYATSMASLAATMSRWGAAVEDRTGLTGKYDFAIRRLSTEGDPSVDWDVAALGLKLEPMKIPTENIIIDHIEYPSPN